MAEKHILTRADDGLHCLSLETGAELWHFAETHGCTPAVDQAQGFIYYQSYFKLYKLNAINGAVLDFVTVTGSRFSVWGNTILVNDGYGYFIVCHYWDNIAYGGAIKVYDADLNLVWEVNGLNTDHKNVIAYADGFVYTGTGDAYDYQQNYDWYIGHAEDCRVIAYDVTDGSVEWTYEVDAEAMYQANSRAITQVVYCNGHIIAETDGGGDDPLQNYEIYILDAATGALEKKYDTLGKKVGSCGQPALSYGRWITAAVVDITTALVVQLGTGTKTEWSPFGTTQLNNQQAPDAALSALDETITLVSELPDTGTQGVVVHDGITYIVRSGANDAVVAFDIETLALVRTYLTNGAWDSTPMVVSNLAEEDVLLVHEAANSSVACFDVATGDLLWRSTGLVGTGFFGFAYYESEILSLTNGLSSVGYLKALNDNFAILNGLVAGAASITIITDELVGQDLLDAINTNIANLNAEIDPPISWIDIVIGETGLSANTKLNAFNIAFKLAV